MHQTLKLIRWMLCASVWSGTILGYAQEQPRYSFDFRGQSVQTALETLVARTSLSLIYDHAMVADKTTQCTATDITSADALRCILRGTPLIAEALPNDVYMMRVDSTRHLPPDTNRVGTIRGIVREAETQLPLIGSNVRVVDTALGDATDTEGLFEISDVPTGMYTLSVSMLGFEPEQRAGVHVEAGRTTEVTFLLEPATVRLSEVVVTPGFFSVMQRQPTVPQTLTRQQIQTLPALGDDVYRSLQRLPGLSGNDLSAKFTVRGGEHEEVLVRLDGLDLYEPFHLKDIPGGGLFSILDADAVAGIDMTTGAFTAEYGNRLSGVLNIQSAPAPTDRTRSSLGLSLSNMRFQTEGHFADKRGSWLVVARRGYLDLVLRLANSNDEIDPVYYDVLGKVTYALSPSHRLSAHLLTAQDKLNFTPSDNEDVNMLTSFGNTYAWMNVHSVLSPRLFLEHHVAVGRLSHDRFGVDQGPADFLEVHDDRTFRVGTFRQDWTYEASEHWLVKGGLEAKRLHVDYAYDNITETFTPTQTRLTKTGTEAHAYLSHRLRPWQPLTLETGLRFGYASWTDDQTWSPRANVVYALRPQTQVRFGWGLFHQIHGLHQLEIKNRDDAFYPAERAEHRVVGIEQALGAHLRLRVEAYDKHFHNIRPRFMNVSEGVDAAFPEVESDRVQLMFTGGRSRGLELLIQQNQHTRFNWQAAYSLAWADQHVAALTRTAAFKGRLTTPVYSGTTVPRAIDQRHTLQLDATVRPNSKWSLNLSWTLRSGWPYTDVHFERINDPDGGTSLAPVFGPVGAERLPAYHRFDVRLHRMVTFTNSRLAFFIDIHNLFNRENVWYYENQIDARADGSVRTYTSPNHWMPLLPSFGLRWDWFH